MKDNLVVSGYRITGYVATSDGEAVAGVHFLLFAPRSHSKPFKCQQIDIELPEGTNSEETGRFLADICAILLEHEMGKPLCVVRSDESGHFAFGNAPCGVYQIVPFYRSVHTTFDVAPSRQSVEVGQSKVFFL